MKNVHIAVLCASIITMSAVCGCIDEGENKKEEMYILKAVISVDKNIVWIVYPDEKSEIITFDASDSEGDELEYYWDFGDNETGEGILVTHTYTEAGTYQIKLKITDKNNDMKIKQTWVYVNYKAEYDGNISKGDKIQDTFSVKFSAKKATITLTYTPTYPPLGDRIQMENLDLSVLAKWNSTYEYVSCSNNTNDNGEETVNINHYDILYHEAGEWLAEVYYNETSSSPYADSVDYYLSIEVYYNY